MQQQLCIHNDSLNKLWLFEENYKKTLKCMRVYGRYQVTKIMFQGVFILPMRSHDILWNEHEKWNSEGLCP